MPSKQGSTKLSSQAQSVLLRRCAQDCLTGIGLLFQIRRQSAIYSVPRPPRPHSGGTFSMEERALRLGSVVDDYCSKCRLLLDHAVQAIHEGPNLCGN